MTATEFSTELAHEQLELLRLIYPDLDALAEG
jgi:hypothetical protein